MYCQRIYCHSLFTFMINDYCQHLGYNLFTLLWDKSMGFLHLLHPEHTGYNRPKDPTPYTAYVTPCTPVCASHTFYISCSPTPYLTIGTLPSLTLRWGCNLIGESYVYTDDLLTLESVASPPTQAYHPNPTSVTPISLGNHTSPSTLIRGLLHLFAMELAPIVMAAAVWGVQWRGRKVLFQSDNSAAIASHIAGISNTVADALSRNRADTLHTLFPAANASPSPIPLSLQELILDTEACWTSQPWRQSFKTFMDRASLATLPEPKTPRPDGSCGFMKAQESHPSL